MRIIRFLDQAGAPRWGVDRGEGLADLLSAGLFEGPPRASGALVKVARLLAPLQPANLYCIGLNYRQHAKESGAPVPNNPVVFMKPTTALNNPGDAVRIPACCTQGPEVDYECELAVVIGKTGRDIPESRAMEHVLGYSGANDVSARLWQKQGGGGQWVRGKSFDTFCPLGPALVTPGPGEDEIADPQALRLRTLLNGQVMQDNSTADMIFSVARIISFISQDTTLLAGTVILTGTPEGVGFARKPPVFLKKGDEVVVEIERVGRLVNRVE